MSEFNCYVISKFLKSGQATLIFSDYLPEILTTVEFSADIFRNLPLQVTDIYGFLLVKSGYWQT